MKKFVAAASTVLGVAACLSSVPAMAQANRTFVSGHGADTGACGLGTPCRSFSYAISQTNAGGEITVLDPAGYGSVSINKAMSIVNDGVGEAGVTVTTAVDAITVAAGASDVVNLRGLTLVGGAIGGNGVTFTTGGTLNIQNSVIRGFTGNGLNITPSAASNLNVSDTILSANGNDGVLVGPGSNKTVNAMFERVQALGNTASGFAFLGGSGIGGLLEATADDCVASNNLVGFQANQDDPDRTKPVVMLSNVKAVNNGTGVMATGTSGVSILLTASKITGNSTNGYNASNGGEIASFGNNAISNVNVGSLITVGLQ